MTLDVAIMYAVATVLGLAAAFFIARLARGTLTAGQVVAYRMVGVMLAAAACLLAAYATALHQWSTAPLSS